MVLKVIHLTIWKTTDGGTNWIELGYFAGFGRVGYLNDVFFFDDSIGLAVGEFYQNGGNIIKTTDGGTNWMELHSSGEVSYNGVFGVSESTWFAVGKSETGSGIVMRTTDGGITWDLTADVWGELQAVNSSDSLNGSAVGCIAVPECPGAPMIHRTSDGGISWVAISSIAMGSGALMDIYFIDSSNGWAVGKNFCESNFTILHTTNGGISFVEEEQLGEVPTEILLSQNYPNPFNPSTKIKYSIPQTARFQIIVFDVLGNKIETLVSEQKPVGTYELNWNATNLSSGVYVYQLRVGSFIEIKKMLLLK